MFTEAAFGDHSALIGPAARPLETRGSKISAAIARSPFPTPVKGNQEKRCLCDALR